MMATDIASGAYDPTRDPPFITPEDGTYSVSPFDQSEAPMRPGYFLSAGRERIETFNKQCGSTLLKLYALHRHIHHHQLVRRGFVKMCRDFSDVEEFRVWWWNMVLEDEDNGNIDALGDDWVWPANSESMERQMETWYNTWKARQLRVEQCRARWKIITEERDKQRRIALNVMKMNEILAKRKGAVILYHGLRPPRGRRIHGL